MNRKTLIALLAAATATTLAACGRKSDATAETSAAAAGRPVTVAARSAGSGDADLREINSYRLTMDDVRKWSAIKKKADAMKLEAKDTASNGADDDDSLDGFEAKINATPKLKALIESEGMDTRDFAVVTWTMIQAAFIQMAVDQGASLDSLAKDKDVNVENLKFLKAHEQEIDALQK